MLIYTIIMIGGCFVLIEQIEVLREELKIELERQELDREEILKISFELDELIKEYQNQKS